MHGMRVNVKSMNDIKERQERLGSETLPNDGWVKAGSNITYKMSKLSQPGSAYNSNYGNSQESPLIRPRRRKYYQLSFDYTFTREDDIVYFAYAIPYTFSKLHNFLKNVVRSHDELLMDTQIAQKPSFIRESKFCHSLSGLEVPMLTITSNVQKVNDTLEGVAVEIDPSEFEDKEKVPINKYKKYIIVCGRVHPGESNASYVVEGFLKFIVGMSPEAIELRKRIIFKVVPITNPDGVIAGNYRTSLAGNDLNRQFISPNPRLHPTVHHIKKLVQSILDHAKQPDPICAFIDIHGHSRKKSVFMYGPHYPLHNERYFKSKVLPKLLDEKTQMFRFYSCKFRIEKSKLRAARVVLFKEYGIMNCFTLEASFHGFIDKDRATEEFTVETLE